MKLFILAPERNQQLQVVPFCLYKEFQQTSQVQQQTQAAAVEGLHTRMQMLQLASENVQQTVKGLELQGKQGTNGCLK